MQITEIQIAELRALAEERYFEIDGGLEGALDVYDRFLRHMKPPKPKEQPDWTYGGDVDRLKG